MMLQRLLNIDKPLIQAPMAGAQNWELAAAVSEAGALGSIPCGMLSKEQVLQEIEAFKAHSSKPYNLNFFCHQMPEIDTESLRKWVAALTPFYEEFGVQPPQAISGLRMPFDEQIAEMLAPYRPPVLSFHFGLPAPQLVEQIKSWGSVILSSATTLEEGKWLEQHGADAVIAQGLEAGGHRAMFLSDNPSQQSATEDLVVQLSAHLAVPVIAAGGIATQEGIQAVMSKGACGAQIGTAYLLCDEAKTSSVHREALKNSTEQTSLTNVFSGRLARGLQNRVMRELGVVSPHAPAFPFASIAMAPLRAKAESLGSGEFSPLWSGTNRSGCKEISARAMTELLWPDHKL